MRRASGAINLRGMAMERILEPEIMDDRDADAAYARADFSDSNQTFADRLAAELERVSASGGERRAPRAAPGAGAHAASRHGRSLRILDLGCGPADVTIRIARKLHHAQVTGVDGAEQMLRLAREAVRSAELTERIELHLGRVPGLDLPEHGFDAVVSKDMLHHLPDPHGLWTECLRLGRSGGLLQVMDLIRPSSPLEAREIVERVASREHPLLKADFYHSLCAAFTPEEVRAQLAAAGLALGVERVGDRHWLVRGVLGGAAGVSGGAATERG
ncbi:MAG: class I SAM-dependent methyltransferase [Steroidobacteraceae bacterium]